MADLVRRLNIAMPATTSQIELLCRLAALIRTRVTSLGLRVAIDGPDAAGKTTLADGLARVLRKDGVPVLRASIDGFHNPASVRHRRRDEHPALSYYEDSFDEAAIRRALLDPLGPMGDRRVCTQVYDYRSDRAIGQRWEKGEKGAVLLFDGVFLLKPALADGWDLTVRLCVDPAETIARALIRDIPLFGSAEETKQRYRERYLPGQALYGALVDPDGHCDVLIDNNDPEAPRILRIP